LQIIISSSLGYVLKLEVKEREENMRSNLLEEETVMLVIRFLQVEEKKNGVTS
jgi:hypothetical protein